MKKSVFIAAAAGTVASIGSLASGAGTVINLSGATLLQNFLTKPAAYNDFIDVDSNGISGQAGTGIQSLAPANSINGQWVFVYRSSGSGNGFRDLIGHSLAFDTTAAGDNVGICGVAPELTPTSRPPDNAYQNRILFISAGVATGTYNAANPGGHPTRTNLTTLEASTNTTGPDGTRMDIAILDVPSRWFVRIGGTANPTALPGAAGYGQNTKVAVTPTGAATSQTNQLTSLGSLNLFDPTNLGAANSSTIFDTPLFWAPIGPMTNFGVGRSQITITELSHLFSTGRLPSGENLMAVTRDVGSGTRNAFTNALGITPDFGVGENIGLATSVATNDLVGPNFQASNKGSNGRMEATVFNHRLAVGYAGTERAVEGGWALPMNSPDARADFLSTLNNIYPGATTYVRPTIDALLDNNENGWVIGGPAALSTVGDPKAATIADGGTNSGLPAMRNNAAAEWINNVRISIENFIAVPGDVDNIGMPGELAATQFILTPALDFTKSLTAPTTLVPNASFNASLQAYSRTNNIHTNPVYQNFNASGIGRTSRTDLTSVGGSYSDGVAGGTGFRKQSGALQTYGVTLPLRNKIAGDFNADGLRNINDIPAMLDAFDQRNGGPVWVSANGTGAIAGALGSDAIIEVLGDFNGDGNFGNTGGASPVADQRDVRYFADGLAVDPATGLLNRRMGFASVDNNWGCNFFNTVIGPGSNGIRHYQAVGTTPGYAPVGNDGRIDGKDIDYIFAQFKSNTRITDGAANWSNVAEAVFFDLSADVDGNLIVNQADADMVVQKYLNTSYGDTNLDAIVNAADIATITANIGTTPATWARGNVDGNAVIDAADLAIANASLGAPRPTCVADLDGGLGNGLADGGVDISDLLYFLAKFEAGSACVDVDNGSGSGLPDGGIDISDLLYFLTRFENGC
jgi:hypothetical protein